MRSRPPVRVQSIEEAVGRRKRRFGGCAQRVGGRLSLAVADLVDVNGASVAAIIEQVKCCPSGALTYELLKRP